MRVLASFILFGLSLPAIAAEKPNYRVLGRRVDV